MRGAHMKWHTQEHQLKLCKARTATAGPHRTLSRRHQVLTCAVLCCPALSRPALQLSRQGSDVGGGIWCSAGETRRREAEMDVVWRGRGGAALSACCCRRRRCRRRCCYCCCKSVYLHWQAASSDDVPTSTRGITNHNNAMITLAFIRVVMIIPELPRVTLDLFKSGYFLYPWYRCRWFKLVLR